MIREYQSTDEKQLLDAWYNASLIAHHFLDEAFFEQERKNIVDLYFPNSKQWVYEKDGNVVGFIAMLDNEVGGIFVDPSAQGQGIGQALMDYVRKSRDFLELDVFKDNEIGRRFYDRYGFQFVREYLHEETGQMTVRLRLDN